MFPLSYYQLILVNICNWIFFISVVQMCVLLVLAAALLMWCHCVCVVPGSGLSDVAGRGSQSDGGDTWGPQRSQEILETAEVSSITHFECERTELKNEHSSSTSAVVHYATYCRLFFLFWTTGDNWNLSSSLFVPAFDVNFYNGLVMLFWYEPK